ncbi:MAG: hypothetical protein WC623_24485 [Pedobacter sp.]|uniref:head-tail joining protein n=1 Tax=Pedobacter sp. TaxID=1411316 RepID=UPI0035678656
MPGSFIAEDLNIFLNSSELGTVAAYGGNSFNVQFFDEFESSQVFGSEAETSSPSAIVKDSDVIGITHGATITINNTAYKVRGIQPDKTGLTILILSKD